MRGGAVCINYIFRVWKYFYFCMEHLRGTNLHLSRFFFRIHNSSLRYSNEILVLPTLNLNIKIWIINCSPDSLSDLRIKKPCRLDHLFIIWWHIYAMHFTSIKYKKTIFLGFYLKVSNFNVDISCLVLKFWYLEPSIFGAILSKFNLKFYVLKMQNPTTKCCFQDKKCWDWKHKF